LQVCLYYETILSTVFPYDTSGGNADAWRIEPGKKRVLAEIEGPGCIKHIWMTLGFPSEDYCRRMQ